MAKEKIEKGKEKKVVETPTTDFVVFDEVFQQMSVPHRGTKRNYTHLSLTKERVTQGPIVMDAIVDAQQIVDELILNSNLVVLLSIEGPRPPAFFQMKSFMDKV
jgi:hypothetical protein